MGIKGQARRSANRQWKVENSASAPFNPLCSRARAHFLTLLNYYRYQLPKLLRLRAALRARDLTPSVSTLEQTLHNCVGGGRFKSDQREQTDIIVAIVIYGYDDAVLLVYRIITRFIDTLHYHGVVYTYILLSIDRIIDASRPPYYTRVYLAIASN